MGIVSNTEEYNDVSVIINTAGAALSPSTGISVLPTAPLNPSLGIAYYDSTLGKFRIWDGTQWVDFGGTVASNAWFHGVGAPPPSLGADGQTYFREDTSEVYVKTGGVWSVSFLLTASSIEYANILNKPNITYEFPFADSTNIVVADHGMDKKPAVRVLDSAGTEWHGAVIDYTGTNGLVGITVTFTSLFGGKLILS